MLDAVIRRANNFVDGSTTYCGPCNAWKKDISCMKPFDVVVFDTLIHTNYFPSMGMK